jgi:hypothetical protein
VAQSTLPSSQLARGTDQAPAHLVPAAHRAAAVGPSASDTRELSAWWNEISFFLSSSSLMRSAIEGPPSSLKAEGRARRNESFGSRSSALAMRADGFGRQLAADFAVVFAVADDRLEDDGVIEEGSARAQHTLRPGSSADVGDDGPPADRERALQSPSRQTETAANDTE